MIFLKKEIHQFYTFYPKIKFPWGGVSGNLLILFSFQNIGSVRSFLEDVNGRHTTTAASN